MKLPSPIDTTALAKAQDRILSSTDYTREEAATFLRYISQWEPMLALSPVSNLTIRQKLITLGLLKLMNAPIKGSFGPVEDDFNSLRRNGYWAEGPDYAWYTKTAFLWHADVVGGMRPEIQTAFDRMWGNYLRLVAPDGALAVPEASDRKYPVPEGDIDSIHEDDSWICRRWASGAYLLVGVDEGITHPSNLHVHQCAGYFALYDSTFVMASSVEQIKPLSEENGVVMMPHPRAPVMILDHEWKVRCRPYTGWDPASVPTDNGLQQLLPPGALLPTWRVMPPRIRVSRLDDGVRIRWSNDKNWFDCVREIRWDDRSVEVRDKFAGIGREKRVWDV